MMETKSKGFMACGKYYEIIESESYIKYLQKLIHQIQNRTMKNKIQQTKKFQEMIRKTPFLKTTYLNPNNVRYISELVGQCERLGREYLNDKNIPKRDLDIVDEILINKL